MYDPDDTLEDAWEDFNIRNYINDKTLIFIGAGWLFFTLVNSPTNLFGKYASGLFAEPRAQVQPQSSVDLANRGPGGMFLKSPSFLRFDSDKLKKPNILNQVFDNVNQILNNK